MSFAPESEARAPQAFAKPEALMAVPVGLASPLWGLFAGAAVSGAAWWWMTRWTQPKNLEAMFGAAETADPVVEAELAEFVPATLEVVEAVAEAVLEPVAEPIVEAASEPVIEPVLEAAPDPVIEEPVEPAPALETFTPEIAEPAIFAEAPVEEIAREPASAPRPRKKAASPLAADLPD